MEGNLDANMISILRSTPGIVCNKTGIVCQLVDPSDWVKLLTMHDPTMVVKAGQWIRVHKGVYKGDLGFVTDVETWGVRVLVTPCLKGPTAPQAATSLKQKRTATKPKPILFNPNTFSSIFQCLAKHLHAAVYTSHRQIFDHGLLHQNMDFHSIFINSTTVPIKTLELFNCSSHPSLSDAKFPHPEEWVFEGEQVTVGSSEKEATVAVVKSTHLEVGFATDEVIEAISWYNVCKIFSSWDFVSVMSGPSRGMMGWVEHIEDDSVYLLKYKEEGNLSTSFDDTMVSFILITTDIR